MQVSLVSFYGNKATEFCAWIRTYQDELGRGLEAAFRPYALGQVHATIIGLEGCRQGNQVRNISYRQNRNQMQSMDLAGLLKWLQQEDFPHFRVQLGGFRDGTDYGFTSQGQSPYRRSFSIREEIAVAMGWPVAENQTYPPSLDQCRRQFNALGILHKWHRQPDDVDNDFFLVLGRVDRTRVSNDQVQWVETTIREQLSRAKPLLLTVDRASVAIVSYGDPQLPVGTTRAWPILKSGLTPDQLQTLYLACD